MGSPRRRTEFLSGRALLRQALEQTVGEPGRNWEVGVSPGGKPVLLTSPYSTRVDFSISHSGGMVFCAVATKGSLGADIEQFTPRRAAWAEFARQVLHPIETHELAGLDEPLRWQGLYRAWTLKEAVAKAMGLGLALPFPEIAIAKNEPSLLALPDAVGMRLSDWQLFSFQPAPEYFAAVAWHPTLRFADSQHRHAVHFTHESAAARTR